MKHQLVKSSDGSIVNIGDRLLTFRGEMVEVTDFREPRHTGSSGRVYVKFANGQDREFFPNVIDCEIVSVK